VAFLLTKCFTLLKGGSRVTPRLPTITLWLKVKRRSLATARLMYIIALLPALFDPWLAKRFAGSTVLTICRGHSDLRVFDCRHTSIDLERTVRLGSTRFTIKQNYIWACI
jgi:hypothetical protein